MSLQVAQECLFFAFKYRREVNPFILSSNRDAVKWDDVQRFGDEAASHAETLYAYAALIQPVRLRDHLHALWEELIDLGETLVRAREQRDRSELDYRARIAADWLTNLIDELERYLRAETERQWLAKQPLRRRYQLLWHAPFVRRRTYHELVKQDKAGLAVADY